MYGRRRPVVTYRTWLNPFFVLEAKHQLKAATEVVKDERMVLTRGSESSW